MALDSELAAIKDAWDKNTGDGRDESARQLADAYVEAHPEYFESLKELPLEDCVKALEVFRTAGLENERERVEVWLLHRYEPQHIGGPIVAQIRVPSTG